MRIVLSGLLLLGPFPTDALAQWVDDGTVVRLTTAADKVGVGTTLPGSKLEAVATGAGNHALKGRSTATNTDVFGVYGEVANTPFYGYGGYFRGGYIGAKGLANVSGAGSRYGVYGETSGGTEGHYGVYGKATSGTGNAWYGVYGTIPGGGTAGVYGNGGTGLTGVYGKGGSYSGYFEGGWFFVDGYAQLMDGFETYGNAYMTQNLNVSGWVTKGGGSFTIDHPLDPENKILSHSFVESPEMKNVYDGIAVLDAKGEAAVELPSYFEALNKDFRYQLTPLDSPAPGLFVKARVKGNRFVIAGGPSGQSVSWQVTGVRHDPYALSRPLIVEQEKGAGNEFEKGKFLQPEARGKDPAKFGHGRRSPPAPAPTSQDAAEEKKP